MNKASKTARLVDKAADAGKVLDKAGDSRKILLRNPNTKHAKQRIAQRGISERMVQKTLENGQKYYDNKNKTISYFLDNLASGKILQVSVDPLTGKVVTVIKRKSTNFNTKLLNGKFRWKKILK